MSGVGCRVWDVGCGMWDVGCGVWGVGCGVWGVVLYSVEMYNDDGVFFFNHIGFLSVGLC